MVVNILILKFTRQTKNVELWKYDPQSWLQKVRWRPYIGLGYYLFL